MNALTPDNLHAAEALFAQAYAVPVYYLKPSTGELMDCLLTARGEQPDTALVAAGAGEQLHWRLVPLRQIIVPAGTAAALDAIARTQRRQDRIQQAARERPIPDRRGCP